MDIEVPVARPIRRRESGGPCCCVFKEIFRDYAHYRSIEP